MGRGKSENKKMKIYNTIQNSGTIMNFPDQNLKIKNSEQLKHRNIMNEILWIYGMYACMYVCMYIMGSCPNTHRQIFFSASTTPTSPPSCEYCVTVSHLFQEYCVTVC